MTLLELNERYTSLWVNMIKTGIAPTEKEIDEVSRSCGYKRAFTDQYGMYVDTPTPYYFIRKSDD